MKKNFEGFTLIELLIVITILGILSVLGARQFGDAIAKANAQSDQSNAQTIASAVDQAIIIEGSDSYSYYATVDEGVTFNSLSLQCNATKTLPLEKYLNAVPTIKASSESWKVVINGSTGAVTVKIGNDVMYPVPATYNVNSPYNILN